MWYEFLYGLYCRQLLPQQLQSRLRCFALLFLRTACTQRGYFQDFGGRLCNCCLSFKMMYWEIMSDIHARLEIYYDERLIDEV